MPLDGTGNWVPVASTVNPAITITPINSTDFNALLADLKTALSTAMFKDGQQTPTANIKMSGFKLTGLAAAAAAGDALRYEQLFTTGNLSPLGNIILPNTAAFDESLSTVISATAADIWTATGNVINYTGTATATSFANAPQAGTRRTLICAAAAVFTASANMLIDGVASGANYTAQAGDQIDVTAFTTSQFYLAPRPIIAMPTAFKVGSFTRDISLTTNLSITGIGFKPRHLRIEANISGSPPVSLGMTDGTTTVNTFNQQAASANNWATSSKLITIVTAAGAENEVALVSFDTDGYTLSFSKTGSPTGTANCLYTASR